MSMWIGGAAKVQEIRSYGLIDGWMWSERKRGTWEALSLSVVSGPIYWEGTCFRNGKSQLRFGCAESGMPVRSARGDIKKAGACVTRS